MPSVFVLMVLHKKRKTNANKLKRLASDAAVGCSGNEVAENGLSGSGDDKDKYQRARSRSRMSSWDAGDS